MSHDTSFNVTTDPTLRAIESLSKVADYPVIGSYVLCTQLGAGGAGAVFMGYHAKLQRPVAIKVLNPLLVEHNDQAVARFEREAILSSQFRSPYIVPVTDAGTVPGTHVHYLVMELIDGENAEDRVHRRGTALEVAEALQIALDASRGLADAHAQDVIHRDLKPSNIMISASGDVRLADLGIATSLQKPNLMLTQADDRLGTPQYMSPEQFTGLELDGRTDVYSMGVTLHYLLSGAHPYDAATAHAVGQRVMSEPLRDLTEIRQDVPDAVLSLIASATDRDREARIPSAEALVSRLEMLVHRFGGLDLSDHAAGGENRERFVHLGSEELQSIARKIEAQTTQPGRTERAKRNPLPMVIVMVLMILVGSAAVYAIVGSKTPIDQRVLNAQVKGDHTQVAELLKEAFTSTELVDSSRAALIRTTSNWLTADSAGPSSLLATGSPGQITVLSLLATENDENYTAWVASDVDKLTTGQAWDRVHELLEALRSNGGPTPELKRSIAESISSAATGMIKESNSVLTLRGGLSVLDQLADSGAEDIPRLARLVNASAFDGGTLVELRSMLADAADLGVLGATYPDLVRKTDALLDTQADPASIGFLRELAQAKSDFAPEIADIAVRRAEDAAVSRSWREVSAYLDVIQRVSPEPDVHARSVGARTLESVSNSVQRDNLGTTRIAGQGSIELLEKLHELGIPGATRWLIETRVKWTEQDQDRMTFADSVTPAQRRAFPGLLDTAISESNGQDLARVLYIRGSAHAWNLIDAPGEVLFREMHLSFLGGLQEGSADCAASLMQARELALGETDESWQSRLATEGIALPDWKDIDSTFLSPAAPPANQGRVAFWHAYGLIYVQQDQDFEDPGFYVAVAEKFVTSFELGYTEAKLYAPKIRKQYLDQAKIDIFSSDQLARLGISPDSSGSP